MVPGCRLPSSYVLVIAEKPKAARRIAEALGGRGARRCGGRRASYWLLRWRGENVVVASAVGHLFGLTTRERGFPVFNYEWRPLWEIDRNASYTRPYFELLMRLSRRARLFVNACDYDIEGSVIGYMVIKWFGDLRRARRAKFSALTPEELRRAFSQLGPLDFDMVEAGLARHELDWIWGINVSRALMDAVKAAAGKKIILSAGRVQTPTLREAVRRDLERRLHAPLPFFKLTAWLALRGWSKSLQLAVFESRGEALEAAKLLRRGRAATVSRVTERKRSIRRPYPFNLGDLQAEAARLFGYSPYYTQKLAEELYLDGLISYPRTNSQKLPPSLDVRAVLESLASQPSYRGLVHRLLAERPKPSPRNGPKEDPAHPAIHPTGAVPRDPLSPQKRKLYDLIVRRFLATLSWDALVAETRVRLTFPGGLSAEVEGRRVVEEGWLLFYGPYSPLREEPLPLLRPGDKVPVERVNVSVDYSRAPEPYTKLSLVKWMERVGIGTEATRARIVEILFDRGYLESKGGRVRATDLGIAVVEVLEAYFSKLASVELTREFEELLEAIRLGKARRSEVVEEAKKIVSSMLLEFKEKYMREAGERLAVGLSLLAPRRRCKLCRREAESGNLCRYHAEAVKAVEAVAEEWIRRGAASSREEYLRKLSSLKAAGDYVREAARYLLSMS